MTLCTLFGIWCAVLSGPATITDGDTLKINGQSIRIHGIDAEELNEVNGPGAKQAMIRMTAGKIVQCTDTMSRTHNRIVAVCTVGKINIGAEMVRTGYALDCAHYSKGEYRKLEPEGIRQRLSQKPYC